MGKKIIFISLIVIGIGGMLFLSTQQRESSKVIRPSPTLTPKEKPVDYKASFAIFTHGTFRVFTVAMYHNLSKDVFIQADNPNVVHVKKEGITWDHFFKTLPFSLTKSCLVTGTKEEFCNSQGETLKFYLNGVRDDDLLNRVIKESDKALISFGKETENQIRKQFQAIPTIK